MSFVTPREAIHALVDELDDADLERAKVALEDVAGVELTDGELAELGREPSL